MAADALIVLCPGQGAQAVGMGKAWFDAAPEARAVFEQADRIMGDRLGEPLSSICFGGSPERVNRTDVCQPGIFVTSIACWRAVLARRNMGNGEQPVAAAAGLSLGEYTALVLAGAMSFEDGLELVALRGRAMQDAADSPEARLGGGGGMLALIGCDEEQARTICDKSRGAHVLVPANFNAPGQIVLSGHRSACDRASEVAKGMGIKSAALSVAGAFHSPLMAQAADRLGEALAKVTIREPRCPVLSNVTGVPHGAGGAEGTPSTIRRRLVEQLTQPVRWAQNCEWMAGNVRGEWFELAPGKTLAGLMRRINKDVKVTTNDTP